MIVLRKADVDLRICGDYRIAVNYKICSDSFPIPNVETVLHALSGTNLFYKN